MDVLERVFAKAKEADIKVAFPEATEEKILLTAREVTDKGYATVYLVGVPADIKAAAEQYNVSLEGINLIDTTDEAAMDAAAEKFAWAMIENYPSDQSLRLLNDVSSKPLDGVICNYFRFNADTNRNLKKNDWLYTAMSLKLPEETARNDFRKLMSEYEGNPEMQKNIRLMFERYGIKEL